MSTQSVTNLHTQGQQILFNTIPLVLQSMLYGVHIVLIPFAIHILLKQNRKLKPNMYLFFAMLLPFVLSSAYWAVEFAEQVVRIHSFLLDPTNQQGRNVTAYADMFNAIILMNYIISDGIVVWRAWALCKDDYNKTLLIPVVLTILTILSVFATIGVRIATFFTAAGPAAGNSDPRTRTINILQVSVFTWSLLANLSATSIISHKAWRHRQVIREGLQNPRGGSTKAERIFSLLIESGFLYCISAATILVFSLIRLPYGTLGDIYTPVNIQIAGIYPTIVIVVVGLQGTMNNTSYWHSGSLIPNPMNTVGSVQFARDPTLYNRTVSKGELAPESSSSSI